MNKYASQKRSGDVSDASRAFTALAQRLAVSKDASIMAIDREDPEMKLNKKIFISAGKSHCGVWLSSEVMTAQCEYSQQVRKSLRLSMVPKRS